MSKPLANVTDHGFYLSFVIDADLSQMTDVRVGILRPNANGYVLRDLDGSSWNTLTPGDTLNVEVLPGDLTVKGTYLFQIFARRVAGLETELSISSEKASLLVGDPVVVDPWEAIP